MPAMRPDTQDAGEGMTRETEGRSWEKHWIQDAREGLPPLSPLPCAPKHRAGDGARGTNHLTSFRGTTHAHLYPRNGMDTNVPNLQHLGKWKLEEFC